MKAKYSTRGVQEYLTLQVVGKVKEIQFGTAPSGETWNVLNNSSSEDSQGSISPKLFWNQTPNQLEWEKP